MTGETSAEEGRSKSKGDGSSGSTGAAKDQGPSGALRDPPGPRSEAGGVLGKEKSTLTSIHSADAFDPKCLQSNQSTSSKSEQLFFLSFNLRGKLILFLVGISKR